MPGPLKIMILQTRHIESISYLTAELVKAFPSPQYQVTLVYLEAGQPSAADRLAHDCVFLGLDKTAYKGLRLAAQKTLRQFLAQHSFDVVIANMYKPVHLLMQVRAAVKASVCIGIIHAFGEFDRPLRRWMLRWALDKRWHMVGVSQPVRDYLIAANCGLQRHNTSAINNAVDVAALRAQMWERDAARAHLRLPADTLVFGTIGRCVTGKRHLELIQAFAQFSAAHPNALLVIMGDGELLPSLKNYVEQQGLTDKVLLSGYIVQAMRLVRALDVFVFPSQSEGFGLALLEAMAGAVPAIVNDVEPLRSLVAGCGAAVDSRDTAALAAAMGRFYHLSPEARQALGEAHLARVRQHYDIGQYRAAYRALVEQLLPAP